MACNGTVCAAFNLRCFDKNRWDWEQEQNRLAIHGTPCIRPKRILEEFELFQRPRILAGFPLQFFFAPRRRSRRFDVPLSHGQSH